MKITKGSPYREPPERLLSSSSENINPKNCRPVLLFHLKGPLSKKDLLCTNEQKKTTFLQCIKLWTYYTDD